MRPTGLTDLKKLLRRMSPKLTAEEYVFRTFPSGRLPATWSPLGTFREDEGISAICRRRDGSSLGRRGPGCYRLITLRVRSSLTAVGLLAAVTGELANAGIACNAVSAFHHDHLLVPSRDARRALAVLRRLSRQNCG